MSLQEKMYLEVESWMSSEEAKLKFLEGKEYSEEKFNYWLAKWKADYGKNLDLLDGAEMYIIKSDGTENLIGIYDESLLKFKEVN